MDILMWLVPTGVVAVVMMVWATWAGRPRPEESQRTEADYERFVKAITKRHPGASHPRAAQPRDRSTGIAVRPSRGAGAAPGRDARNTRRSA